ncbi:hypothetical protein M409DRAFT_17985 [Zasmidium cellare ATCC 36951]|uniref:AB hydrolase-1 domain-containing protein n=1 Tax=Zasmidium cellare ATCC 36951 TaxID=1080233 RepID=A0A6A6CZV4_ZASCE|nr:uncharacterized protein M409DRAFT_17985 [Zasmidium cellare ATCC 36951]KAF2171750.1 hypothetical protein M409DRAFT_17985 [Zasmidium cellare ATCC 36951]
MRQSLAFLSILPLVLTHPTKHAYQCIDFDVPLSFQAPSLEPAFLPFKSHYDSVAFLQSLSSRTSSDGPSPYKGQSTIDVNVTIAAQFCFPPGRSPTTVQILSHGLGFDHVYWSFGGQNSEYNYVKAATAAGYSTLSYDRLGNGGSTKGDAYTLNQATIETEVLKRLTDHVRSWDIPCLSHLHAPTKVTHVGHSFGSQITNQLVSTYPNVSDGIVLTGYSTLPASVDFAIGTNFFLAKDVLPQIYGNLSTGYLIWDQQSQNQYLFLHWPNFSPQVLAEGEQNKWPLSISELLSTSVHNATNFSNPALIISGQYDGVFCGFNCTGVLPQARTTFSGATPFETYVQPNTGHGINLHYNSTGAYQVINNFLARNVKN